MHGVVIPTRLHVLQGNNARDGRTVAVMLAPRRNVSFPQSNEMALRSEVSLLEENAPFPHRNELAPRSDGPVPGGNVLSPRRNEPAPDSDAPLL